MPSRARASSTRTPAVRKVRFCWYASSISRVSVGSLNTVHQSRCSEAVGLTALFPCSSHLSATVVGGVLKSGPSRHPWASNASPMITRPGFRKRDILVPATITNPKLSPFIAALTHWCVTDEIIRGRVYNLTAIAFSPSTYRRIIFLANSRQRVKLYLLHRKVRRSVLRVLGQFLVRLLIANRHSVGGAVTSPGSSRGVWPAPRASPRRDG